MKDLLAFYFSATLYHVSSRSYTKVVVPISTTPYCSSTHVCILFKKGNYSFSLLFYAFLFLLFELSYALIHTAYNSKSQAQGQILVLPRCRTLHSRPGRSPANNATSPWPTRSVRRPCAARCARPSRRFSSSALPAYAAAVFLFFRRTRAWPCVHDAAR